MGMYRDVFIFLLSSIAIQATSIANSLQSPQVIADDIMTSEVDNIDNLRLLNMHEDAKLEELGKLLTNILIEPWPKGVSPLLYVENYDSPADNTLLNNDDDIHNLPFKRSRYYRKYPWKRQNSRYVAENRYLCQPSKEDVFRLLVALHEARQGNLGQTVNFCNRKRPATAVFTNIRFLG